MCNVEQSAQAALEEFDLDFTQLGRALPGVDFADIDCQFRAGAVLKGQLAGGTLDHGLADRLKRRAIHAANDLLSDRCVRNRFETQPPTRSRVLHLANLREAAMQLGLVLTVCIQRRPSRRSLSAIPAFFSACSGVSR